MKAKINIENIRHYAVGRIRKLFYHTPFDFLIPKHIREQIDLRIKVMKKECYENGMCIECGCVTPALQMAEKECDGACYPPLVGKKHWNEFTKQNGLGFGYATIADADKIHVWGLYNNTIFRYNPEDTGKITNNAITTGDVVASSTIYVAEKRN